LLRVGSVGAVAIDPPVNADPAETSLPLCESYVTVSALATRTISNPEPPAPPLTSPLELFADAPPPPLPVFTVPAVPAMFVLAPRAVPPVPPAP
jgi:hypothetical protein